MYAGARAHAGILAAMRKGVLRGREHTGIGQIACVAEDELALAISRGGAAKRYAYKDPNEDAAGFATGTGGRLLAVADVGCDQGVGEYLDDRIGSRAADLGDQPGAGQDVARNRQVENQDRPLVTALPGMAKPVPRDQRVRGARRRNQDVGLG